MLNATLQMFEAILAHKGWNNSTASLKADIVKTSNYSKVFLVEQGFAVHLLCL